VDKSGGHQLVAFANLVYIFFKSFDVALVFLCRLLLNLYSVSHLYLLLKTDIVDG
jgi:hypothetical protein